jgi:hypothetical protein
LLAIFILASTYVLHYNQIGKVHNGCDCLLVWTGTKSIRFLVQFGWDRSIVDPSCNLLFRTRMFQKWLIVELSNSGYTMWYWNDLNCVLIVDQSIPKLNGMMLQFCIVATMQNCYNRTRTVIILTVKFKIDLFKNVPDLFWHFPFRNIPSILLSKIPFAKKKKKKKKTFNIALKGRLHTVAH